MQGEKAPAELAQPEDSSCCCTATAMEEEVQISGESDTAGASEGERSPPQSAHSGKRRGSAARASVIRNRIIQKKYLQRKKVPLLAPSAIACTLCSVRGSGVTWACIYMDRGAQSWFWWCPSLGQKQSMLERCTAEPSKSSAAAAAHTCTARGFMC